MVELTVRSKRLMRELQEIQRCPVANISAEPVGGNLTEWHGNIRGDPQSIYWRDVVIHFKIVVPSTYPTSPPLVSLFTFFPHINVLFRSGQWTVCLDMLEPPTALGSQITIKYRNWSSAYTIRSVLVQLSSFILTDHQPVSNTNGGIQRVITEAIAFRCPHASCGHSVDSICPRIPTEEEVSAAPVSYPPILIKGEVVSSRLEKCISILDDATDMESLLSLPTASMASKEGTPVDTSMSSDSSSHDNEESSGVDHQGSLNFHAEEDEWVTVHRKKKPMLGHFKCEVPSKQPAAPVSIATAAPVTPTIGSNIYLVIEEESDSARCDKCRKMKPKSAYSQTSWKKMLNATESFELRCIACNQSPTQARSSDSTGSTAAAPNQNFLRREKRRQQKKLQEAIPVPAPSPALKTVSPPNKPSECGRTLCTAATDVGSNSKDVQNITPVPKSDSSSIARAGLLTRLPRDLVIGRAQSSSCQKVSRRNDNMNTAGICSFLELDDILTLGLTCKSMHDQLDGDWWLWRDLFSRKFGNSSALVPTGDRPELLRKAWKYAYLLQANRLTDDLQCFYTRATCSDEGTILGIPVDYTINPKTKQLDYITSTFDIISYSAYSQYAVRRSVWGEKFLGFLPLYIDEPHFLRGMDRLFTIAMQLMTPVPTGNTFASHQPRNVDKRRGGVHAHEVAVVEDLWTPRSPPEMVLALLVKMMNTQVVLLCDNGITASETSLTGYCQIHRLMLAISSRFPQLRKLADKRLEVFIRDPKRRVKQQTPSLGDLLCMLTISEKYHWNDIAMIYLFESFDRAVLWACSKDNSLINLPKGDPSRLEKFFAAHTVGLKLCLFHAVFLDLLVNSGTTKANRLRECENRYDLFLGRPVLHTRRLWHEAVKEILELKTWPQFFRIGRFPKLPSPPQLLAALENAVDHSLAKGYHNRNTRFENIMKSGVSRILLKGNSYSVAPNIQRLKLCERWRYDGNALFLDASCLLYDFNGALVGIVDYSHRDWREMDAITFRGYDVGNYGVPHCGGSRTGTAPVRHSGDVLSDGKGEHTIDIDLTRLPKFVCALVFTVSAWTTTLVDVRQPSAHLFDVLTDTELCAYQFEDVDTGNKTAVTMCKLQRPTPSGRWALTSVGHVGMGRADHYGTILEDVINLNILESPKQESGESHEEAK